MLKWLVQRVPDGKVDVITDDPLATINLGGGKRQRNAVKEIYSVNRTNPLYHETDYLDEGLASKKARSPGATASTSSGYGSSATPRESIHVDPKEIFIESNNGETEKDNANVDNIQSPPAPIWPQGYQPVRGESSAPNITSRIVTTTSDSLSDHHVPFVILQRNPRFVNGIGMFQHSQAVPGVLEVSKNESFVSKIQIGSSKLAQQQGQSFPKSFNKPGFLFKRQPNIMSTIGEVSLEQNSSSMSPNEHDNDFSHDSLVTETLLQMTSFKKDVVEVKGIEQKEDDDVDEEHMIMPGLAVRKNEDMDKVIKELTQAVIKSRNVATLTKAMKQSHFSNNSNSISTSGNTATSSSSSYSPSSITRRERLRNSIRALKKVITPNSPNNANTRMRQLWEKSGMKTNGRKLLVDSTSEEDVLAVASPLTPSRASNRRRRRKDRGTTLPSKKLPSLKRPSSIDSTTTTTSSTLSTDPQYLNPFVPPEERNPLYKEVYRSGWQDRLNEDQLSELSSSTSGDDGSQKRVTFSKNLVQKKSPIKVLLNPSRLDDRNPWEKIYSPHGDFGAKPDQRTKSQRFNNHHRTKGIPDYESIFTSPYFDYRRTHSKTSDQSLSHVIPIGGPSYEDHYPVVLKRLRNRRRIFFYWKSILTILIFGTLFFVIVALTIYFTNTTSSVISFQ